jgi:hypothetical protein
LPSNEWNFRCGYERTVRGGQRMTALPRCSDVDLLGDGERHRAAQALTKNRGSAGDMGLAGVVVGAGVALVASLPVRLGAGRRSVPVILEEPDFNPARWATDRRPQCKRRRGHQIAMMVLRAHIHPHVPCRGEVDLEALQLRDRVLTHRRVDDAQPAGLEVLAQAIEQPSRPTLISYPSRPPRLEFRPMIG